MPVAWPIARVLAGLILVAVLFGVLIGPQFFSPANLELMARQTAIVCIAALGMTMVIVAGGIDLSVGIGHCTQHRRDRAVVESGCGPVVAAAGAVAAGAACGMMNGVLITRLRVVPFIITLGTMLLVRGAAKGLADERRIEAPITWLNGLLRTVRDGSGAAAAVGHLDCDRARHRRRRDAAVHAIRPASVRHRLERADRAVVRRARRAVEDCRLHRRRARSPASPGVMEFSRLSVGDPTVAIGAELDVIAAVIIGGGSLSGGKGTVIGTIAGAGIMTVIQIGCSSTACRTGCRKS